MTVKIHADIDLDHAPVSGMASDAHADAIRFSRGKAGLQMSDAEIDRNNRLGLLMEVHGRWNQKRAAKAQPTTKAVESMGKSSKGICEVCSTSGVMLRVNHGKNMCASCQSLYAHVFNRLPVLATVLKESGKLDEIIKLIADEIGNQALMQAVQPYVPEQVAVELENGTLDKIAEVVGYKGESGEGLIEAVRASVSGQKNTISANLDLVKALFGEERIVGQSIADTAAMQIAAQLEDLQRKVEVICRHCGVVDVDEAIRQVAHSEAIFEELMLLAGELAGLPGDLPMLLRLQGEELLNMRTNLQAKQDQIFLSADQLSDAEQRLLADEQIFARIREVIAGDGIANGDLPTAIGQVLSSGDEVQAKGRGERASVDGHLLDMALDAMRGKIIGLDPDRIAMLREAA